MDIKEFQKSVLEKAKRAGFENCEIYYQGGDSLQIAVNGGRVEQYETSTASGASFRGIIGGRTGFAYTERLDEASADFIVNAAKENAKIFEDKQECEFFAGAEYADIPLYNEKLAAAGTEDKIEMIMRTERAALEYADTVKASDRCIYADGNTEVSIMNTRGLNEDFKANSMVAFVSVIAEKGGDIKTGGEYFAGNEPEKLEPEKLGRKAAENAVNMLGARSVKSGVYNLIFKNTAMASILSTFSASFTAEQAAKGLSMLEGREGTKIASDAVSIRDDGLLEGGFASAKFDGEGVPCQNKAVVENGILRTLLYDLKYGAKAGKSSTGNGFRAGYKSPVMCSCTNFYIVPSDNSFEGLAKSVGNGIYITDVQGLHSGANPVSGDFSLSAEGFLIENGETTSPVEQITVASNFFRLLESISAVGNDLRFNMGGVGSPAVAVEKVSVSGL